MEEETLSSKIAFNGEILNVRVDEIRLPGGRKSTREIIEHSDAVAVVPIDRNGNMILVKQYRRGAGKDLLEIPAGCVEPGENPEETVKRELQEEIGYLPNKITSMGGFYASPGYNTEYLYLYLATELVPAKLHAEDTDSIEVVPVPIKSITDYIKSGKICDAKSVAGILYYMFMR
ncbi:MAG: NUDIX hydrolase [Dehalococcoidales bacterium]|jgi:ADP-ribose pyrophosphatase|nr:NUDIX hydrolase [Dehalococcoidales bacterium]